MVPDTFFFSPCFVHLFKDAVKYPKKMHDFNAPDEIKLVPSWSDGLPYIQQVDALLSEPRRTVREPCRTLSVSHAAPCP